MPIIYPIVSSILLYLSHPGNGFFLLNFIALIPLIHKMQNRNNNKLFLSGYLSGLIYFLLITDWIRILHLYHGSWLLLFLISLAAALFQAFFWGLSGYVYGWLKNKKIDNVLLFPAVFTIFEWIRSLGVFGNTIGSFAYHQAANQYFIPLAGLIGASGVIFLIVLINQLIYQTTVLFFQRKYRRLIKWVTLLAGLLVLVFSISLIKVKQVDKALLSFETSRIAVLQPSITQEKKINPRYYPELKRYYLSKLANFKERVDFIILPETIVAEFLLNNKSFMWNLNQSSNDDLIFGTPVDAPGPGYFNSMVFLEKESGRTSTYHKIKIVPFGEYLPGRGFFLRIFGRSFINKYFGSEYQSGKQVKTVAEMFAPGICFESFSSEAIRNGVNAGGKIILIITNDGWFKRTSMLQEHQAAGRVRAIENNRFIIQAANTGISFVAAPDGRVINELQIDNAEWLIEEVPIMHEHSIYGLYGNAFIYILIISLLIMIYVQMLKKKNVRR